MLGKGTFNINSQHMGFPIKTLLKVFLHKQFYTVHTPVCTYLLQVLQKCLISNYVTHDITGLF